MWSQLIAVLAPPVCAGCHGPAGPAGALLCAACLRDLPWLGTRVCRRCAQPRHVGAPCPAAAAPFATAWAPVAYERSALALVRALKFRGELAMAGLMASQMAANAPGWALDGAAAVVPVPPARHRARRRGFDPAALLAKELAVRLGLPVAGCLHRSGRAPRQLGARRVQRRAAGRIEIRVRTDPPAGTVLLVDDVHTTGATLTACARALAGAGVPCVRAVTSARTL